MLRFRCHNCEKKLKADERLAGATIECPRCGARIAVPIPDRPATEPSSDWDDVDEPFHFGNRGEPDELMDMTPMVDAVFLLLLFFMVTAAFSLQKSIQVPAPDPSAQAAQDRTIEEIEADNDYIIVRIDRDDTVWVEDRVAPSRHELLSQLREARNRVGERPPTSLMVIASGDASHEKVVMALDAGSAVGMENVRLAPDDADELF
ncbi:MAG: biopolymer transporter ExbD [Pirellulales bacterium]